MTQWIETNGIRLAYSEHGSGDPPILLLHGLTANRQSFGGLLAAGLADNNRCIALDLRGRGESDKPETGYHMADHAADVEGVLDALGIDQAVFVGHSFGGLLSMWMAANQPERISRMVIIDAGREATDPSVLPKIKPSLDRLGTVLPSAEAYITAIKGSPYYTDGFWDPMLEAYYRADLETLPDGQVRTRVYGAGIEEAVNRIIGMDWADILGRAERPALLIHATASFGPEGAPPVLTEAGAEETVELLPDCQYQPVPGHHISMVFGDNAPHVVAAIRSFLLQS